MECFTWLDSGTGDELWKADGRFLLSGARGETIYAFDGRGHKLALERDATLRNPSDQEFVYGPRSKQRSDAINGTHCAVISTSHYNELSKRLLRFIGETPEVVMSNDSAVALVDEQTEDVIWQAGPVLGDMVFPFRSKGQIYTGVAQPGRIGAARVLAYRDPLVPAP